MYVLLRLHIVDADKDRRHPGLLQDLVSFDLRSGGPASPASPASMQNNRLRDGTGVVMCWDVEAVDRLTTAEVSVKQTSKPRAKE
jgi:hypothetical protein